MGEFLHPTKRRIQVTAGNIRNKHLYLNGALDLFPPECVGDSQSKKGLGRELHLHVAGLPETIRTDLPRDAETGKPRGIFRGRKWVGEFFKAQRVQPGDVIEIEKLGPYEYALRREPICRKSDRNRGRWHGSGAVFRWM